MNKIVDKKKAESKSGIVLYTKENGDVELRADVKGDTLWATLDQIADLFDVQKAAISKHFKNIFESGELVKNATVSKMETVQIERNRSVRRTIEYYNLDGILSVGYRVNSKQATQFRIWATGILREHIMKGYSLNRYKLNASDNGFSDLDKAIAFIKSDSNSDSLEGEVTVKLKKNIINKSKK